MKYKFVVYNFSFLYNFLILILVDWFERYDHLETVPFFMHHALLPRGSIYRAFMTSWIQTQSLYDLMDLDTEPL